LSFETTASFPFSDSISSFVFIALNTKKRLLITQKFQMKKTKKVCSVESFPFFGKHRALYGQADAVFFLFKKLFLTFFFFVKRTAFLLFTPSGFGPDDALLDAIGRFSGEMARRFDNGTLVS